MAATDSDAPPPPPKKKTDDTPTCCYIPLPILALIMAISSIIAGSVGVQNLNLRQPWDDAGVPLNADGRIRVIPNFLTVEEVEHVLVLGDSVLGSMGVGFHGTDLNATDDVVLLQIEEKIGVLTGIAPHADEDPFVISRRTAVAAGSAATPFTDLVHDQIASEMRRTATVLIYLTGEGDEGLLGGETLFPCAGAASHWGKGWRTLWAGEGASRPGAQAGVCDLLSRGFDQGWRSLATGFQQAMQSESGYNKAAHMAAFRATTLCGEPSADALRVRAARGTAVLFLSAKVNDPIDAYPEMWHGGCSVTDGKVWTLQKYKEPPRGVGVHRILPYSTEVALKIKRDAEDKFKEQMTLKELAEQEDKEEAEFQAGVESFWKR